MLFNLLLPYHWYPTQLCCASIWLKLLVLVASCPGFDSLLYLSAAVVKHYTREEKIQTVRKIRVKQRRQTTPILTAQPTIYGAH